MQRGSLADSSLFLGFWRLKAAIRGAFKALQMRFTTLGSHGINSRRVRQLSHVDGFLPNRIGTRITLGTHRPEVRIIRTMSPWKAEKGRVPCLDEDVRFINEQVVLILRDSAIKQQALKFLHISPLVADRIVTANASGIATAIGCGVPLVTFAPGIIELLISKPNTWRPTLQGAIPEALWDLARLTLLFARQLVLTKGALVRAYFGLSHEAVQALEQLGLVHIQRLSQQFGMLLRLRAGEQPEIWDDLLIGERATGPHAHQIAQEAIGFALLADRAREMSTGRDKQSKVTHGTQGNRARSR